MLPFLVDVIGLLHFCPLGLITEEPIIQNCVPVCLIENYPH